MDTKILLSLMMVGIAGFGIAMGTMAYFSDTETSNGNTIAAGALDLKVDGFDDPSVPIVVAIKDLKPSIVQYSDPIHLTIYNNPGTLWKHIKNVTCGTGVETEPECTEQGGIWVPNATANAPGHCHWGNAVDKNDINRYTWLDIQKLTDNSTGKGVWGDVIPEREGVSVDDFTSCWIPLGTYGTPGVTNEVTIRQSFHLGKDVTNWAQGDACTFTEEFMVLQTNAGDPQPATQHRVWDKQAIRCVCIDGTIWDSVAQKCIPG